MEPMPIYDYNLLFKIIVIGDSGVGKSAFLKKMIRNEYIESDETTVGVDFFSIYNELDNGKIIKTQIWDTAGQEVFRSIVSNYYRNASGIVLMCDVTDIESFNSLESWIADVQKYSNHDQDYLCLVANKIDLTDKRKVTSEMLEEFTKKHDMPLYEVSVKDCNDLKIIFKKYMEYLYLKFDLDVIDTPNIYQPDFQNKIKEIGKYGILSRKNVKKRKLTSNNCYTSRDFRNCCIIC
tara:strand:- start:82 stop:789 length:708 start_codon:yes stop_codon:yes gene_type:complete